MREAQPYGGAHCRMGLPHGHGPPWNLRLRDRRMSNNTQLYEEWPVPVQATQTMPKGTSNSHR